MKTRSSAKGVKTSTEAPGTQKDLAKKSQSAPKCAPNPISKSTDRYALQTPRADLPATLCQRLYLGRPAVDGRKSPVATRTKPEKQQSDQRYYEIQIKRRLAMRLLKRA